MKQIIEAVSAFCKRNIRAIVVLLRVYVFAIFMLTAVWYAYQIAYISEGYLSYLLSMCIMIPAYRISLKVSKYLSVDMGKSILKNFIEDDDK